MKSTRHVVAGALLAVTLGWAGAAEAGGGALDTPGAARGILCAACHGPGGNSRSDTVPILAGMPAWYFKKAIEDYAAGKRPMAEMEPYAKMVKELGVDEVAAYFAAQAKQPPVVTRVDPAAVQRGKMASGQCNVCHGEDGKGDQTKNAPPLAGQPLGYLRNQMLLFKIDQRSPGDPPVKALKLMMRPVRVSTLSDLAAYYATVK